MKTDKLPKLAITAPPKPGPTKQAPLVYVNGCFDCLHAGHIAFLKIASLHGPVLVGLNSSLSVNRLKGRGRPIEDWGLRADKVMKTGLVWRIVLICEPEDMNLPPDAIICRGWDQTITEWDRQWKVVIVDRMGTVSTSSMVTARPETDI